MEIREAADEKFAKIKEDSTRKIPRIYHEVSTKYNEDLNLNTSSAFLQDCPFFRAIQSTLYQRK